MKRNRKRIFADWLTNQLAMYVNIFIKNVSKYSIVMWYLLLFALLFSNFIVCFVQYNIILMEALICAVTLSKCIHTTITKILFSVVYKPKYGIFSHKHSLCLSCLFKVYCISSATSSHQWYHYAIAHRCRIFVKV